MELDFTKYYLIDWLAFFFSFASVYFLGNEKKIGFTLGAVGSVCWLIVNIIAQIIPGVIFGVFMTYMNIRGLTKWNKKEAKKIQRTLN